MQIPKKANGHRAWLPAHPPTVIGIAPLFKFSIFRVLVFRNFHDELVDHWMAWTAAGWGGVRLRLYWISITQIFQKNIESQLVTSGCSNLKRRLYRVSPDDYFDFNWLGIQENCIFTISRITDQRLDQNFIKTYNCYFLVCKGQRSFSNSSIYKVAILKNSLQMHHSPFCKASIP